MSTRKMLNAISALAAAAVSVSAVSVCSYAALLEGSAENKVDYEILPDPYVDYAKVDAIEAVITVKGGYANGGIGVNGIDTEWKSQSWEADSDTITARLDDIGGVFAPDEGKGAVIFVQFWFVAEGVSYTVDSVTLYDADGKEVTAGEEPVERPEVKFPDAEPLDIDNDSFAFYSGNSDEKIDIAKALGDDFGSIGKITATFKWGNDPWNGTMNVNGITLEDGTSISWSSCGEIGNLNENLHLQDEDIHEYTFTAFDAKDSSPIVELKSFGATGEISAYGVLNFGLYGIYGDEKDYPDVSNITFYNKDGEVIKSFDYETAYDNSDVSAETDETVSAADNAAEAVTEAPAKGSPDTGVEDVAVVAGVALTAAAAVVLSRKRK